MTTVGWEIQGGDDILVENRYLLTGATGGKSMVHAASDRLEQSNSLEMYLAGLTIPPRRDQA